MCIFPDFSQLIMGGTKCKAMECIIASRIFWWWFLADSASVSLLEPERMSRFRTGPTCNHSPSIIFINVGICAARYAVKWNLILASIAIVGSGCLRLTSFKNVSWWWANSCSCGFVMRWVACSMAKHSTWRRIARSSGFFLNFPLFFLLLSTVLGIGFESKLLQAFCTNKIQF